MMRAGARLRVWLPWGIGLGLAGLVVYLGRSILVPLFLAFLVAYVFDPVIDRLEAWGIRRGLGILLLAIGLGGIVVLGILVVLPEANRQISRYSARLPGYRDAVQTRLGPLLAWIQSRFPGFEETVRERGLELVKEHLPGLLAPVLAFIRRTTSSVVNLILGTLNLVMIPILAFYLLKDIDRIKEAIASTLPMRWRDRALPLAGEMDATLRRFLRGQMIVAVILSVVYAVGLTLVGVPLGIFLGLVAGMANIVPYLGVAVGLIPALGLSFLDAGDPVRLLGVIAVFVVAQVLEGMWITPRVVGKEVGLHPVVVLLAVIIGGQAFGFLGILLAVPFTAAAGVLFRSARRGYLASSFYTRPATAARQWPARRLRNRSGM